MKHFLTPEPALLTCEIFHIYAVWEKLKDVKAKERWLPDVEVQ